MADDQKGAGDNANTNDTPTGTANAELRGLYFDTIKHVRATMQAPVGTLKAAQLQVAVKFLSDNGVDVRSLQDLERGEAGPLEDRFKDYDGDTYSDFS